MSPSSVCVRACVEYRIHLISGRRCRARAFLCFIDFAQIESDTGHTCNGMTSSGTLDPASPYTNTEYVQVLQL